MEQFTKSLFCANCQTDTVHTGAVDMNGDIVYSCSCGRFLKLPAPQQLDGATYESLIADHAEANVGQVSLQASIDALTALSDQSETAAPAEVTVAPVEESTPVIEAPVDAQPIEEVTPIIDTQPTDSQAAVVTDAPVE